MFRALLFFLQIAVLVTVSVWFANRPGLVEIDWQGWRLETSVGVLALAIFLLVVAFALLYSFWRSGTHSIGRGMKFWPTICQKLPEISRDNPFRVFV